MKGLNLRIPGTCLILWGKVISEKFLTTFVKTLIKQMCIYSLLVKCFLYISLKYLCGSKLQTKFWIYYAMILEQNREKRKNRITWLNMCYSQIQSKRGSQPAVLMRSYYPADSQITGRTLLFRITRTTELVTKLGKCKNVEYYQLIYHSLCSKSISENICLCLLIILLASRYVSK